MVQFEWIMRTKQNNLSSTTGTGVKENDPVVMIIAYDNSLSFLSPMKIIQRIEAGNVIRFGKPILWMYHVA